MKKILTHWTFAFVTLFALTWIGLQDPQIKEILINPNIEHNHLDLK